VKHWRITHNRIHDNNNIGIDAIGFEPTLGGPARYTRANRARDGLIADNVVLNIISRGNPAYFEDGGWCNCADGIYIDGGTGIRVMRNRVIGNDIGIEVAAENGRGAADHVVVADNFVARSGYVGIATGGYCNGADDCGGVPTGSSWHNTFEDNWLRGNNRLDDGSPEVLLQYHVHDAVLRHNTVIATNSDHVVYGTQPDADGSNVVSDHNRFRVVGGDATDAELDDWWAGVRNLGDGVLLGAYWVLYPGTPVTRADQFLARLDASCPGWRDRPFILQVDCEKWGGKQSTVPSKAEIQAFCDRLVAKMPKLRPIVYAPKWVYENSLDGLKYPTWASNYVAGSGSARALYPGDSSARWAPYSGEVPAILQYSSSAVIGGQSTSDADAYRGTLAQLTALVAPGWSEDVNVDDLVNNTSKDAIPETPLGHWALSQGIKDGTLNGQRVAAWQAIQNLGTQLVAARADVAVLKAQVAAIGTVSVTPEQLTAAFLAALEQLAAKPA